MELKKQAGFFFVIGWYLLLLNVSVVGLFFGVVALGKLDTTDEGIFDQNV